MKTLSIDIETYSDVPLQKAGVYRYVESPNFEILLFAYSVDSQPVQVIDLACGEQIPKEVLLALEDETVIKWAFNTTFERICLSRFLGYPTGEYLEPESWRCSMIWAATMGLPLSLEGVGAVLGLEKQKLSEGKDLIKYFCQPCAPTKTNGQRTRNRPFHAPDKWAMFKKYNIRDVETEMGIQQRLAKFPVTAQVWDEYHMDQEINDRGVRLDMELVAAAIEMDTRSRTELTETMKEITELENPNSVQQMKAWLSDNGLETDTLGKKAVVELLKSAPPKRSQVLTLRQQLAKSSVRKYQAMEKTVCADGRARGMFQFYGANRTGRFSGRNIQLQNLPQKQKTHYERYINSREDWQFAGLYFDEGITGTKAEKRPELLRLISDCEAKKIDFVITKSISRFSRNTTDCLALVRKLQSLDIPLFFEKENINTGSMESELFLAILSSMAEGESTSISENAKWSIKRRFQNGTFKLSYTPYGYDWDGENIIVNPEQAEIVKRIFTDVLSGKGTHAIADELNTDGIASKKNSKWTATTIRAILANEKYTGDVIFQKTYTDENFNRHINYGEVDQYMAPDHHEAIISHEDFDASNALVAQRASEKGIEKGNDKYQKRYAFSGKIICGECGDTFKHRIHTCTTYKYVAWACNTHLKDKSTCNMKYVRDDEIKAAFVTMLNKLIYGHRLILAPYLKALENSSGDEAIQRIQHLELLLAQNSEQRETLTKLMAQGYINQILYNQETNALLLQAETYRSDIEAITICMTGDSAKVTETNLLLHFVSHTEMLTAYSEELFESYADHIEITGRNEIKFVMKCGLTFTERIGD